MVLDDQRPGDSEDFMSERVVNAISLPVIDIKIMERLERR